MRIKLSDNKQTVIAIREGLKRTGGYCSCLVERNEDRKMYVQVF